MKVVGSNGNILSTLRAGMNMRLLVTCMLSIMLLFCVTAESYQYTNDVRFAAGSSVVIDDDSEIDLEFLHTPAIVESLFEFSLPVVSVVTSFTVLIQTIKPTLDFTSLNSRAPPLS